MRKTLRYLRIAWSVGCVIICLPLINAWVRSCEFNDMFVYFRASDIAVVGSQNGVIYFAPHAHSGILSSRPIGWVYWIGSAGSAQPTASELQTLPHLQPGTIRVPYWSLVATACTLGALPWLRRRFSLRTLLIATTLVAVGLGLIVYANSKSEPPTPTRLQPSGTTGLLGTPLPSGAKLIERRAGDPATSRDSGEYYSIDLPPSNESTT